MNPRARYLVPLIVAGLAAVPTARATAPTRTTLQGASQLPAGARSLGAAPSAGSGRALIALKHRDQAGLDRFVADVSNPSSSEYGKYLSPAQFEARYAPTSSDVDRVRDFATANGLSVTSVPRNRAYVAVSGSVSELQRAFSTTITSFRLGTRTVQAPTSSISVPASLSTLVSGVDGLNTADVATPMASPPAAYVNTGPCSSAFGDTPAPANTPDAYGKQAPAITCGYTPQQLQGAYGTKSLIAGGLDGSGQRVAIIDAYSSPQITTDANTWSSRHGLPAPKLEIHDNLIQSQTPEVPSVPTDVPIAGGIGVVDPQGWAGEETLDVEAVHAMAPGAQIVYVGANSPLNMDLETAQNDVVANKRAQIVSNSYGGTTDDENATSDGYWQQAAAQGMGVYFSSGDAGDETTGGTDPASRTVDAGGNSPYVTAVGGTTLGVTKDDGYGFETYWGAFTSTLTNGAWAPALPGTFAGGGGGGTSQVYAEPDYQKGVVPDRFSQYWKGNANAASDAKLPGRVVPDVSMVGDSNSGFLMGMEQDFDAYANPLGATLPGDDTHYSEYRIGGTSLSSPLMAGMMALADQAQGTPHGFANPALYKAGSGAFHDVTAPSEKIAVVRQNFLNATNADGGVETVLRTAANTGTLSSVPGYDDSTGLGSPNGLSFLRALAPNSTKLPSATPAAGTTAPATQPTTPTTTGGSGSAKKCPTSFTFKLHAPSRQKVVSATITAAGKTVTRKGKSLTKVTVAKPKAAKFTITITTRTNRGHRVRSTRTYSASGCSRGKVTTKALNKIKP